MKPDLSKEKLKRWVDPDFVMETLTDETLGPHAHLALLLIIVVVVAIVVSIVCGMLGI